jgi:hypothetical protein
LAVLTKVHTNPNNQSEYAVSENAEKTELKKGSIFAATYFNRSFCCLTGKHTRRRHKNKEGYPQSSIKT